jgi:hypothetical protein
MHLILAHHGVNHAFEIVHGVPLLQSDLCHAGPVALFNEPRQGSFNEIWPIPSRVL